MSAEIFMIYPVTEAPTPPPQQAEPVDPEAPTPITPLAYDAHARNRVLTDIYDSNLIFEARTEVFTDPDTLKTSPILTDLPNWKTFVGIELTTVPKLIGAGSYVESKHIAEREFSFTVSVKGEDILDTEEITDKLMEQMYTFAPVQFYKVFVEIDETRELYGGKRIPKVEVLEGYLTGFSDWTQKNGHAYATFSARCPNPEKITNTYNELDELIGSKIGL